MLHATTSETEIELFQPLKEYWNHFSYFFSDIERVGKYSRAAINLWNNFEVISDKFPRAKIPLFQSDVDEG